VKLKLGELRLIVDTLPKIIEEKLPVKTSYWLSRALVDIMKEFQVFEDTRKKLIEGKYGKRYTKDKKVDGKVVEKKGELVMVESKDKDGNIFSTYVLTDQEAFNKEFMELAEQEVTIKYEPRPIDDFVIKDNNGKETNTIKGIDLLKLGRLIKEE